MRRARCAVDTQVVRNIDAMDDVGREIRTWPAGGQRRRPERQRVERLIQLTDTMVDELEQLNLADVERVGSEWRQRLTFLFSALPFPYLPRLRAFPSPTEVLDVLFDLQAPLLELKVGRSAVPYPTQDDGWLLDDQRAG
jgi:hypothetical protein